MPDTNVDPAPTAPTVARDAEIAPYVTLPWRAGLLVSISLWCYPRDVRAEPAVRRPARHDRPKLAVHPSSSGQRGS